MIDVVNRCYKFLLELFLTGGGEGLIDMLEQRDLLARWYDPGRERVIDGWRRIGSAELELRFTSEIDRTCLGAFVRIDALRGAPPDRSPNKRSQPLRAQPLGCMSGDA
jgi:hypothetical protein